MQQLQLDLFPTNPTCIWLEEWYEHPFCYLWQTFRLEGCGLLHGFPCRVKEKTRYRNYGKEGCEKRVYKRLYEIA